MQSQQFKQPLCACIIVEENMKKLSIFARDSFSFPYVDVDVGVWADHSHF